MLTVMTGRDGNGFTLIEVMIVIAIIGILAAIAIPQFSAYRVRAFNSGSMSDIKTIAIAQEAYHIENQTYTDSLVSLSGTVGISRTDGVMISVSKSDTAFTVEAYHSSGDKTYTLTGPGGYITGN
ncbi:MAG: prepilin-type N-terminal cleavage/methylation domain-containing protein [Deltaproteobacteria bacterium]|nr:prepilin-type N-terminal cleavage/methylation domain-containing protein [Deltaproteobacteria bacterium]